MPDGSYSSLFQLKGSDVISVFKNWGYVHTVLDRFLLRFKSCSGTVWTRSNILLRWRNCSEAFPVWTEALSVIQFTTLPFDLKRLFTKTRFCCNFCSDKSVQTWFGPFPKPTRYDTFHFQQRSGAALFRKRNCFESSIPGVDRSPIRYTFCDAPFHYLVQCEHSLNKLYSEHLVLPPVLKSVPSQFLSLFPKLQMHGTFYKAVLSGNCPKREKQKGNYINLKHKAFSVSPTYAREVWKRGTWHKGQFQLVQSMVNELYSYVFFKCFSIIKGATIRGPSLLKFNQKYICWTYNWFCGSLLCTETVTFSFS